MNTHNKFQKFILAAALVLPFGMANAGEAPAAGAYGGAPAATDGAPPAIDARMGPGRQGPDVESGMDGRRGPRMHGGMPEHGPHGRPGGPDHAGPPPGSPGMPPPFLHGLDLTEAQQDKVFAILHSQAPYVREQDKALHKARAALHALATGAQYDDAKAAALAQAASQAMSNLELSRVRTGQKLLAVLTAEQRKQVEQRMAAMPPRGPRS